MSTQIRRKMAYLIAPYSHEDKAVIEHRMKQICMADAHLMEQGYYTMSPLFKHFILQYRSLPGDYNYWGDYSRNMLPRCDEAIVIKLDGWDKSVGVADELALADELRKPIRFVDAEGNFLD